MSYNHDYYIKNKEKIKERNKKWREENKDKFYKSVYNYRSKKAKELKEQGEMYCWHSKSERKRLYEKRDRRINNEIENRENQDNND